MKRVARCTESAYLASLIQAPTFYSPYGKNINRLEQRKNLVLSEMLKDKYITQGQYDQAKNEKVVFKPRENTGIKAPHFVMFVKQQLEAKYGQDVLEQGGLRVITTIDYDLQKAAEDLAKKYAVENKDKFNAENVALVAIDPKTGHILAMVGSRDFHDTQIDGQYNVTTAYRQPGSSFKPFIYAEAFNKGYTPDTVLFDLKTQFSTNCAPNNFTSDNGCYSPDNYDNQFRGPISMRNALAQSINIPAIKTFYLSGTRDALQLAKDMGVSNLKNFNQYGLTLVLGGGEVSLLDMTSAYSVFANEGVRNPYQSIIQIQDKDGKVLEQSQTAPIQVLPKNTALEISDILSDNVARTPIYGANSALYFPGRDVAVKTGTTNDYKDVWIIGYTPDIAVGAWAGNNDNSPMDKKISGTILAPFWNAAMREAIKNLPDSKFEKPQIDNSLSLKPVIRGKWLGGISYPIDKISGLLATDSTPTETMDEKLVGGVHDILFWVNKENPRGPAPINPAADPQFNLWEYPVRLWVAQNRIPEPGMEAVPANYDNIHTPQLAPIVSVTGIDGQNLYDSNSRIIITPVINSRNPISKVEFFINDNLVGNSTQAPFTYSFIPSDFDFISGVNTLKVVAYDMIYNKGEAQINFQISGDYPNSDNQTETISNQ
jgi:membrane peptidoglycan carboxypeptidase